MIRVQTRQIGGEELPSDYISIPLPEPTLQIATFCTALDLNRRVRPQAFTFEHPHAETGDGLFAFPSPTDLATVLRTGAVFVENGYLRCLAELIRAITESRQGAVTGQFNATEIRPADLLLPPSLGRCWNNLEAICPAEAGILRFFLMPASTGNLSRGLHPEDARVLAQDCGAIAGCPLMGACIALLWPGRFCETADVMMDCPAGWFRSADGEEVGNLAYYYAGNYLRISTFPPVSRGHHCGSLVLFPGTGALTAVPH